MRRSFVSVMAAAVLAGCATTPRSSDRPVLTQQEAIALSSNALRREGYRDLEVHSVQEMRPNYWRIRFGLAPRGSGRLLDVFFDGSRRDVVKTVEVVEDATTR